ncbi:MAG: hypothetical protein ACETWK_01830 [Candidatus Aminicenantaceae bacterium]
MNSARLGESTKEEIVFVRGIMTRKPSIMLIGLGNLGSIILEFLAREKSLGRIVVADQDTARSIARSNLARLSAMAQGFSPSIFFTPLDINDKKTVEEIVSRESPDIIITTATMQTWWLPDLLPPEKSTIIKSAGFGVWLPVHLTLTMKLMEALNDIDYGGITLTAPFPDVVNCILGHLNLAPTCGVGNLEEIVPKLRALAAERLKVPLDLIQVQLVAHHALETMAFGEQAKEIPPYFLRIEKDGEDITKEVEGDKLLFAPYPLPPGPAIHFLTAGTAVRLIKAFFSEDEVLIHAPGPKGLPGGYPVIVGRRGIKLAPIKGISLEESVSINERSHRFDGIEKVENDGTVVFCPEAAEIIRSEIGYECTRLSPREAEERAKELIARFKEYARRQGIELNHSGGDVYAFKDR